MPKAAKELINGFLKIMSQSKSFDRLTVGTRVVGVQKPGTMVCELDVAEEHTNKMGTMHGGFTSFMVDMTTTCALLNTEQQRPGVSVDLQVSYLAPAKIGETVVFDARVSKAGRKLAFTTCDVKRKSDGVLVAQAKHIKVHPNQLLAYNCSPSFNWGAKLSVPEMEKFQREIGALGYKFQFITLAGFHVNNFGMFSLAKDYKERGMAAYNKLQQAEFDAEKEGYTAVKHQREVGAGFFDVVATTAAGGEVSTAALTGSTEEHQFQA